MRFIILSIIILFEFQNKYKELQPKQTLNSMSKTTQHQYYTSYLNLKSSLTLPMKIRMQYSLLEDVYSKSTAPFAKNQKKLYEHILAAFKKYSVEEQERFLYQTLKLVKGGLGRDKDEDSSSGSSDGLENIKQIQCTCKVKDSFLGFTKWQKKCFKLNTKSYQIKLSENKKQSVISLPYYYVRKSKNYSKTLTLFSTSQQVSSSKAQIYISFEDITLFEQIFNRIFICIVEIKSKQILLLAHQKHQQQEDIPINEDQTSKTGVILNSKVLNEYFMIKDKIIRKLTNSGYKFENVELGLQDAKVSISSEKNKQRVKIEKNYNKINLQELCDKLNIINRQKDDKLIEFEVLETFSTNVNLVYFKYYFNEEIYQFLTILEENIRKNQRILIFKGVDNFVSKQFVDFLYFKLTENSDHVTLKLMGIIKNQQKNKSQAVEFLLSLIQPKEKQLNKPVNLKTQEFWTVREMENIDEMEDLDFYDLPNTQNIDVTKPNGRSTNQQVKMTDRTLLAKKYLIQPSQKPTNRYLTEHPLFKQWKLHKNGGVICTDEQQIAHQKKVFKYIISQIGSNIINRKNILNVSFPVTIFRKQSHLKSVARNFSFAPIFIEKVVKGTPEERVKAVVLLQISVAILLISLNKPFNPILGQTYQGFIDGCPMFLEQTSHHPPISRYMFYGRGYKIHGAIQPKIAIGLNCVKGWSSCPSYLEFDDGTVLEFTLNKIVINGMLFGERTFNFQGINHVFDHKNKIAAEISYGCQTNSVYKKKQLTYDSVSGAIYKITSSGDKINPEFVKKNEKQRISTFIGIWHSQIYFDEKPVYNFEKDLPHQLVDYQNPIPSDGCYRTDLNELIRGNLENAQKEKDFLQQIQRRDKKLREALKKGKN